MAEQLLLFADELRTRAKEILVRAANTDDLEAQDTMRVIAAGYEKLARRVDKRVREARETREVHETREAVEAYARAFDLLLVLRQKSA
jgi:hypothetical protein